MKRSKLFAFSVCLFFLLPACAHFKAGSGSQDALRECVQTVWEAKTKRDWISVYDMTTQSYKDKVDKSMFLQSPKAIVHGFVIKKMEIVEPGKRAMVTVEATMDILGRKVSLNIKEHWQWENGAWRLNLSPPSLRSLFKPGDKKE